MVFLLVSVAYMGASANAQVASNLSGLGLGSSKISGVVTVASQDTSGSVSLRLLTPEGYKTYEQCVNGDRHQTAICADRVQSTAVFAKNHQQYEIRSVPKGSYFIVVVDHQNLRDQTSPIVLGDNDNEIRNFTF